MCFRDDVIKWKHFPRYWPFVRGIHRSPVNSPHKGQWRGALMFSLICVWINDWVNNREAGDLRRYRAHCDVTVMWQGWKRKKNNGTSYPHQGRVTSGMACMPEPGGHHTSGPSPRVPPSPVDRLHLYANRLQVTASQWPITTRMAQKMDDSGPWSINFRIMYVRYLVVIFSSKNLWNTPNSSPTRARYGAHFVMSLVGI